MIYAQNKLKEISFPIGGIGTNTRFCDIILKAYSYSFNKKLLK